MKSITLWYLNQLELIISHKSGVVYTNQVGGYSCLQEEAEGILTIIDDYENKALTELSICTLNYDHFTEEKVVEVNAILSKHHEQSFCH